MSPRFALLVFCALSLLIGCASSDAPAPADGAPADTAGEAESAKDAVVTEPTPATAGEPDVPNLDEATLAAFAAADAMDGEVDHIVSKCPTCKLLMAGKAEYSLAREDYTLHFCSTTCWDLFNADVAAGLVGLVASVPTASKK